ncbi:hypothetical protein [Streptomyces sp. CBMA152]|uniref:hypothetical protein n=1 Tax=Streptomyces sp. CBMA152 TaxID=1896312 RepID=UPI0016608F0E|nr:hypothetical protein [Streptomyces sp. CBMA152]MBD0746514.1 hypothetical protein [Streptomyces sp. CBMA152]
MSENRDSRPGDGPERDPALARALKRAADDGGRRVLPQPPAKVAERGLRRRRRNLAATAACVVCVVAGTGAVAAVRLQSGPDATVPANPSTPTRRVSESPAPPSESPSWSESNRPGSRRPDLSSPPRGTGHATPSASNPPLMTPSGSPGDGAVGASPGSSPPTPTTHPNANGRPPTGTATATPSHSPRTR